jgi:hypothetical protein
MTEQLFLRFCIHKPHSESTECILNKLYILGYSLLIGVSDGSGRAWADDGGFDIQDNDI